MASATPARRRKVRERKGAADSFLSTSKRETAPMTYQELQGIGINRGSLREKEFIHNGGWYDLAGKFLGWGDLSIEDLRKIAGILNEGEAFFVLKERDRSGMDQDVPPTFLYEKAIVAVFPHKAFWITDTPRSHQFVDQEQTVKVLLRDRMLRGVL
jgi:hypothetical protein